MATTSNHQFKLFQFYFAWRITYSSVLLIISLFMISLVLVSFLVTVLFAIFLIAIIGSCKRSWMTGCRIVAISRERT